MNQHASQEPRGWKEEYNLNNAFIDEQHKYFFGIMNRIRAVLEKGSCPDKARDIFFALAHYAEHYLLQEEIYLKDYSVPGLRGHRSMHQDFIDKMTRFQEDYSNNKDEVCAELLAFLEAWFDEHILKYDREAIEFLNQKGIGK